MFWWATGWMSLFFGCISYARIGLSSGFCLVAKKVTKKTPVKKDAAKKVTKKTPVKKKVAKKGASKKARARR